MGKPSIYGHFRQLCQITRGYISHIYIYTLYILSTCNYTCLSEKPDFFNESSRGLCGRMTSVGSFTCYIIVYPTQDDNPTRQILLYIMYYISYVYIYIDMYLHIIYFVSYIYIYTHVVLYHICIYIYVIYCIISYWIYYFSSDTPKDFRTLP